MRKIELKGTLVTKYLCLFMTRLIIPFLNIFLLSLFTGFVLADITFIFVVAVWLFILRLNVNHFNHNTHTHTREKWVKIKMHILYDKNLEIELFFSATELNPKNDERTYIKQTDGKQSGK